MKSTDGKARSTESIDVLVVDDEPDANEELIEYLSKAGLACTSAGDGQAAVELLAGGCRPGVVVSDLRMPKLDGLQFAEHIGRLAAPDRPEIIFMSGHAGFDDAVQAIRLGARDMLTKPVDGPRLVRAVKAALLVHRNRTEGGERVTLDDLRAVRKVRSRYFPAELFSDPCWEMLLDLYDAKLEAAEVTVTSLGAASGVPLTTALRRMEALQNHGFIERAADPQDKRRTIIRLTEAGSEAVEKFFDSYRQRRKP
jgi:CheY-like chemotaxis protein/predicted transcriptional regulator